MIAEKYCRQPKPEKRNHWGSWLLAGLKINKGKSKRPRPNSPSRVYLPPCNVCPGFQAIAHDRKILKLIVAKSYLGGVD
jgi:hypothetical protein